MRNASRPNFHTQLSQNIDVALSLPFKQPFLSFMFSMTDDTFLTDMILTNFLAKENLRRKQSILMRRHCKCPIQ